MAVVAEIDEGAPTDTGAEPLARLAVRSSPLLEMVWLSYIHEDESGYPARERLFDASPDLAQQMQALWGDEACFTEATVLANQAGVLFTHDMDALWEGLERAAAGSPRPEPLASEKPSEKQLIRSRITRLHRDPALRGRWLEVLRRVWECIARDWENEGRAYVEAVQCDLGSKLGAEVAYGDLEPYIMKTWDGLLQRLFRAAAEKGQEVTVAPAWLARKNLMLSMSDRLIIGPVLSEPPASPTAATRARARRLKALGDPTRLAIFEAIARRPRTVGELARQLRIAQPTVSNHVRLLRDAGLVKEDRDEGRRLSPDLDSFGKLLDEVRRASSAEC